MGTIANGKNALRRTLIERRRRLNDALLCQLQTELLSERAADLRLGLVYLEAGSFC